MNWLVFYVHINETLFSPLAGRSGSFPSATITSVENNEVEMSQIYPYIF